MKKRKSAVRIIRLLQKNRRCRDPIRRDLPVRRMRIRLSEIDLISDVMRMEKAEVLGQIEQYGHDR